MKKNGFTLAEVLITLTIIGVVAALTLPNLNMQVQSSKVGPSLRKFINTMSNANEVILTNNQSNTLRSAFQTADNNGAVPANNLPVTTNYMNALAEQIRGSVLRNGNNPTTVRNAVQANPIEDRKVITNYNDGDNPNTFDDYRVFNFDSGESMGIYLRRPGEQNRNIPQHRPGIFADVLYDIDGFSTGANKLGIDLFVFRIDNRGSVFPAGGSAEASAGYTNNVIQWSNGNNNLCNGNTVNNGTSCAGSVADNNWRVIYQY